MSDFLKSSVHSRGHSFDLIFMKLHRNVCSDDTRVLQKVQVLSLGSNNFSATFYQTYFYYKP